MDSKDLNLLSVGKTRRHDAIAIQSPIGINCNKQFIMDVSELDSSASASSPPHLLPAAREAIVRNFFTRMLFSCILSELSFEEIHAFFSCIGLPANSPLLSPKELCEKLWDINGTIPLEYAVKILRNLEPFLVQHGKCLKTILCNSLMKGCSFEPSAFMYMVNHSLPVFLGASDVKNAIVEILGHFISIICPVLDCKLEYSFRDSSGNCTRLSFAFNIKDLYRHASVEWITLKYFIKYLPLCFGSEPFDDCYAVSEFRTAKEIAGEYCDVEVKGSSFLINGIQYGKKLAFGEFAEREGVHIIDKTLASNEVIVAEDNYFCPVRKRDVLTKGVAYGAPVILFDIIKGPPCIKVTDALIHLSTAILTSPLQASAQIKQKFESLTSFSPKNSQILYDLKREIIYWNSRKITTGIQSRLLLEMLRFHFTQGRDEFYRHELASIPDFIIDKFSTGLTVRIERALEMAEKMKPFVVIEKKGRGCFRIGSEKGVELVVK